MQLHPSRGSNFNLEPTEGALKGAECDGIFHDGDSGLGSVPMEKTNASLFIEKDVGGGAP